MNWIRVATKIASDPTVATMSVRLKVRMSEAVGLIVSVLCQFPEHARDGRVAEVPDELLERWAGWQLKAGEFARHFRELFCTPDGVVRTWDRHNGAAIRKAVSDIERKRDANASSKSERTGRANGAKKPKDPRAKPERPPSADAEKSEGNPREIRAASEVDETKTLVTTASADAAAAVTAPPPPPEGTSPVIRSPKYQAIRGQFTDERHVLAFEQHYRAARSPESYLLDLEYAAKERPSDGAPPMPWEVIGQALHDLSLKGRIASEFLIRSFGEQVQNPTKPASHGSIRGEPSDAEIEASLRRRIEAGEFLPDHLRGEVA